MPFTQIRGHSALHIGRGQHDDRPGRSDHRVLRSYRDRHTPAHAPTITAVGEVKQSLIGLPKKTKPKVILSVYYNEPDRKLSAPKVVLHCLWDRGNKKLSAPYLALHRLCN